MADTASKLLAGALVAAALSGLAAPARAQAPWHPTLGVAFGNTTLNWSRSWEAGVHAAAELTVPLGSYFGVRGSLAIGAPPPADTTMSHQRLYTAEAIARLRVASWRIFRAYGEVGLARVHLRDRAHWADTSGALQPMRIDRTGNLESVGVAVSVVLPHRMTVEARTRRIHGIIDRMKLNGAPDPYFETNSLRMYRVELATSWRL